MVPVKRAPAELEDDGENEDEVEELGPEKPGEDIAVLKGNVGRGRRGSES